MIFRILTWLISEPQQWQLSELITIISLLYSVVSALLLLCRQAVSPITEIMFGPLIFKADTLGLILFLPVIPIKEVQFNVISTVSDVPVYQLAIAFFEFTVVFDELKSIFC